MIKLEYQKEIKVVKKNIKKIMAFLLVGCMVISLTACGGKEEAKAAADTEELKKVTVMTFNPANEEGQALLDAQKKLFETMNPGITLEFTTGTMSIEDGSLITLLNSGEALPDVININAGPSRIGALAEAGSIQPLDQLYEKNGWKDRLNPAATSLCSLVDGKLYEVPATMDSISCYYNKEIFESLNLEVPKTWEEFLHACEVIKGAGIEPIALGARDGYAVGWCFGSILQSAAGTEGARKLCFNESKWTDETGLVALKTFDDLIKKEYISPLSSSRGDSDAVYALLNGKAAMYFVGAWMITDIYANNMQDKLSSFPLPSQTGEEAYATSGLGITYAIPSGIKNIAGAEKWFEFLLSDEYAKMMADDATNNSLFATKAFSDIKVKSPLLQTAKDAIAAGAGRNPSVFIGTETKNAYFQNLQGIVAGIVTPEDAAANIQQGQDKDIEVR